MESFEKKLFSLVLSAMLVGITLGYIQMILLTSPTRDILYWVEVIMVFAVCAWLGHPKVGV